MVQEAVLTCPACSHKSQEIMPLGYCESEYRCKGCGVMLRPKAGECCVYCSYSDMLCPAQQEKGNCCSG